MLHEFESNYLNSKNNIQQVFLNVHKQYYCEFQKMFIDVKKYSLIQKMVIDSKNVGQFKKIM